MAEEASTATEPKSGAIAGNTDDEGPGRILPFGFLAYLGPGRSGLIVLIPWVFIPETDSKICEAVSKRLVAYFRGEPQAPSESDLHSN